MYIKEALFRICTLGQQCSAAPGVMAVVLCRSDGKTYPVSSELRNAPRVVIRNEPVAPPSRGGGKITARTESHYACAEPVRKEVWREAFERFVV